MLEKLKNEPVRLYAIATAALALVAHYAPSVPQALVLGLVAAVLGVGETVRSKVVPDRKVLVHEDEVPAGAEVLYSFPVLDADDHEPEYGDEGTAWRG